MPRRSVIDIIRVIEELEEISGSATRVPGMRKKVMVDVDRLAAVTEQLSKTIPADILEAKEILKQKESILNHTQLEARRIRDEAAEEADQMMSAAREEHVSKVDETEVLRAASAKADELNQGAMQEAQQIVQEAQRKAYRLLDEAERVAKERRDGADRYARETLFDLEERMAGVLGQVRRGIDSLGIEVEAQVPAA
ncbi:MAG: hypothetical protein OXD46_00710 [Chloroflexi bacterium]|nr:hypothetical protein [Chloroflexota bacterium]